MRNEAIQKLNLGIERSTRLVEQLLALSRLESNQTQNETYEQIDWADIVKQVEEEYAAAAKEKGIVFKNKTGSGSVISSANPVLCALMMRNLVDNAVKYSPKDAVVKIEINENKIRVVNSGTKVAPEHLKRLSERFFRPAGQKESGSGLGLAIVSRIAGLYGCDLHFANTSGGFEVKIEKAVSHLVS